MAANITTSASLTYTAGTLRTNRLVSARLTFVGGTVLTAGGTRFTDDAATPKLTTQKRALPIGRVNERGEVLVTMQEQERQQRFKEAIEAAFVAINARIDLIALEQRVSAVEVKADTANDNAIAAQATADEVSDAAKATFAEIDPIYDEIYEGALNP
jgi:hypothetical protein